MRSTVREITLRGEIRWVLDWEIDHKRQRRFFREKAKAEQAHKDLRRRGLEDGAKLIDLDAGDRAELFELADLAKAKGVSIRDLLEAHLAKRA